MNTTTTKGFTLIELLVVVAIIGILAGIIITSLSNAREKARDARRDADIKTIQTALEIYYLDHGEYPHPNGLAGGMISSNSSDWSALENLMETTLPRDPVNSGSRAYQNHPVYSYYLGPNLQYRMPYWTMVSIDVARRILYR